MRALLTLTLCLSLAHCTPSPFYPFGQEDSSAAENSDAESSVYLDHETSPVDPNKEYKVVPLDPGQYYAQMMRNKRKRRKQQPRRRNNHNNNRNNHVDLNTAASSEHASPSSGMDFAFLQPQKLPVEEKCLPPSSVSAFTFMNFIMAATTVAANVVSNANSNNRRNNNNNNDNNDNTNNFNINNNNNNANNGNTIMVPIGKKRRRKRRSALRDAISAHHNLINSSELDADLLMQAAHALALPMSDCTVDKWKGNVFLNGKMNVVVSNS